MRAKKKGIIAAVIGAVLSIVMYVFAVHAQVEAGQPIVKENFMMFVFALVMGAITGFGLAFGFPLGKKWLGAIFGVAATVSIFSFIFSSNRYSNFVVNFIIWIVLVPFMFGLCYLPGIVIGIREIVLESRLSS